jgi:hypothetical protein
MINKDGKEYEFPERPQSFLPGKYSAYPGIYRWRISPRNPQEPTKVLIGESSNLRKRLSQYIHPNNQEMKCWNMMFRKAVQGGAKVECQRLTFDPFTIRGALVSPFGVEGSPFVRRLVENLMLMLSPEESTVIVLNKGKDCWTRRS